MSPGTTTRRHLLWATVVVAPAGFMALFFAWPVLSILSHGFAGQGIRASVATLTSPGIPGAIGATVRLAVAGTIGSVALGLPAAYALFHLRWRGQRVARALATVPFVLPTVVVAAAFSALFARHGMLGAMGLDQSEFSIVLALVFFNVSVVLRIVGNRWAGLDPALVATARTLGASRLRAWYAVTLPSLGPAIGASAAVVFLFCSTSFGLVLVLGGTRVRTVETQIYLQVSQFLDLHTAAVLALVQVVFVAVAFFVATRSQRGAEALGFGGGRDGSRLVRRSDAWAVVVGLVPLIALLGMPTIALVERSLRTSGGAHGLGNYAALLRPPSRSVLPVSIAQAGANSLVTALIATALAGTLALLITAGVTRGPRWSRIVEGLAMAPLGVSSVVVGLGLLLTLNRQLLGVDLRRSWWLVPIAQAVIAVPLAVRILVPAARSLEPKLRAAASSLGASPWRVWLRVDWPLLRAPMGLTLAFAFAIALGEFGATTFVARPDRPTLPTAVARLLSRPGAENVGMGYATAVVLAVVTACVMLASERFTSRGRRKP